MTHPVDRLWRLAAIIVAIVQSFTHAGSFPLLLVIALILCGLELYEARHHR